MRYLRSITGIFGSIVCIMLTASEGVAAESESPIFFTSTLTGGQEITTSTEGLTTTSSCVATFRVAEDDSKIDYKMQCFNIDGLTQGHIHGGSFRDTGPAFAFLFGTTSSRPIFGEQETLNFREVFAVEGTLVPNDEKLTTIDFDTLLEDMRAGLTYVNVHTAANRLGEVRGQIVPTRMGTISDMFFVASGSGDQVLTQNGRGVETDASCSAHFALINRGLKFKVRCLNIMGVTQAHIHIGRPLENGPAAAFLFPLGEPTGPSNALLRRDEDRSKGILTDADLLGDFTLTEVVAAMKADNAYIVIHTEMSPPGEVRGAIATVDTFAHF